MLDALVLFEALCTKLPSGRMQLVKVHITLPRVLLGLCSTNPCNGTLRRRTLSVRTLRGVLRGGCGWQQVCRHGRPWILLLLCSCSTDDATSTNNKHTTFHAPLHSFHQPFAGHLMPHRHSVVALSCAVVPMTLTCSVLYPRCNLKVIGVLPNFAMWLFLSHQKTGGVQHKERHVHHKTTRLTNTESLFVFVMIVKERSNKARAKQTVALNKVRCCFVHLDYFICC